MSNIDPFKLKKIRNKQSLSQTALIRASQGAHPLSRTTLQRIERSEEPYFATHETVLSLANALNVHPDDLRYDGSN